MRHRMPKLAAILVLGACGVGGMTACSSSAGGSDPSAQSVTAACNVMQSGLSSLEDDISNLGSATKADDLKRAGATFDKLDAQVKDAVAHITNPTVAAPAKKMSAAVSTLAKAVHDADGDPSKLAQDTSLKTTLDNMQDSARKLSKLCS